MLDGESYFLLFGQVTVVDSVKSCHLEESFRAFLILDQREVF